MESSAEKRDDRIEQILKMNLRLLHVDVQPDENITCNSQKLDIILHGLGKIGDELDAQSAFIADRTRRLNELVELLLKYTLMDFSQKVELSEKGDEIDAIALGLNTLGEELESHIGQLKEKTENLQRTNEQLEQFVYIASHDLQEPLRTLANYVNLFKEDYRDKFDSGADRYLGRITSATERMQILITDLLLYARLGQEGNKVHVDCNALLPEVLKDLAAAIDESNAQIELAPLPVVYAHYSELKSLFQNLLVNAVKFHKHGVAPAIRVNVRDEAYHYTFSVIDNGIGIEQQHQQRIFSIFQKLHNVKQYSGTGIGLAQCKKIVEMHGGKIWVESTPEQGSTFYFTIPKHSA